MKKNLLDKIRNYSTALLIAGAIATTTQSCTESCTEIQSNKPLTHIQKVELLTASARDYCESVGKELFDYKMVGVTEYLGCKSIEEVLPAKTEVVVDYRRNPSGYGDEYGTALIPKKEIKQNE